MHSHLFRIVLLEVIGFAALVAYSCLNEGFNLSNRIFGGPDESTALRLEEALSESFFIVVIGALVIRATIRSMRRIAVLENMVIMCAWCRRVKVKDGKWNTIEKFLAEHKATTSHGLCQDCDAKMIEDDESLSSCEHA